jgi:hypothetical protein
MHKQMTTWAMAIAALACTTPLAAHHSISMFDIAAPIWIKGTVVSYQVKNPHVMMVMDVKNDNDQVQRFTVEGPNLLRHTRMGADEKFLKPGDVVEVCGFPFKADILANSAKRSTLPSMHGHMVKMPDGKMRLWGPYGKLENCVRPHDQPQAWAEFLNADPLGQEAWCKSQTYVNAALLPSKQTIDKINSLLTSRC